MHMTCREFSASTTAQAILKTKITATQTVFPIFKNKKFIGVVTLDQIAMIPDEERKKIKLEKLAKKNASVKINQDAFRFSARDDYSTIKTKKTNLFKNSSLWSFW